MTAAFGDHIGSLVAVDYIIKQYPWITPLVWVPDYLKKLSLHLLPEQSQVFSLSETKGRYEPTRPTKTTAWDQITSPMKIHSVDYAFLRLCDENPDIKFKNYLQIKSELEHNIYIPNPKYVVITTGFTAETKEFKSKAINEIVTYIISKGYLPVFLGQKQTKTGAFHVIEGKFSEEIDFNVGLNLIDKTTLLEAVAIMKNAACVVGVDNGLLHLAGCTNVPIIIGYTIATPETKMPIRNNRIGWNCFPILPGLKCQGCQVNTNFLYGHDYRKCYRKEAKETKTIECLDHLTSDKFIQELKSILE